MFPNEDDIRTRSYFIWVQEGRPHGRSTEHWLQAEAELKIAEAPAKPKTTRKTAKSPRAKSVKKSV